jgi:uncharacterized membrane protein YgaE (UPF0421/DUF939 family)
MERHAPGASEGSGATAPPGLLARALASARSGLARAARAVRRPGADRDTALLLAKAALATVLAWQFAVHVIDSASPFYAPMAALLVVDRTLVRSLWASAQRVAAVVVGMATAWLVGSVVGVHWWSMLPVIYLALLIARWHRFGDHGIQVPTMVLLSLLTVGGTDSSFTIVTIGETVVGGLIGVLTNAVVVAPLHIQTPRERIADLTRTVRDLLGDMSSGLRDGWDADKARNWYATSTELIEQAPQVHSDIERGRESQKLNPRDNLRGYQVDWEGYAEAVEALRRSQWHVSGIARTLMDAADEAEDQSMPTPTFLQAYASALDDIGQALVHFGIHEPEDEAHVTEYLDRAAATLRDLGDRVRTARLDDPAAWPAYGTLLVDARRLIRELEVHGDSAVVPTDSGPFPKPPADPTP